MKKVVQLSLSLMLMLSPAVHGTAMKLVEVKPKESKNVEPSTELNKIQTTHLPFIPQSTFGASRPIEDIKIAAKQKSPEVKKASVVTPKPEPKVIPVSTVDKEAVKQKKIAQKLNAHLGGKLEDKGRIFAESASENDIDPYLVAAIAIHETGNGESSAIMNKNNVGGMMGSKGLKRFSSVNDSIETLSALIKNRYVDKGLDTIQEISEIYAPVGADNDPNGLNHAWVDSVRSIYNMLKHDTSL